MVYGRLEVHLLGMVLRARLLWTDGLAEAKSWGHGWCGFFAAPLVDRWDVAGSRLT